MVKNGFFRSIRMRFVICVLVSIPLLSGCASVRTQREFYPPVTTDLNFQRYDAAVEKIEAARKSDIYKEKDRLLYYLDTGMVYHYAGNLDMSTEKLTMAEEAAEELFTKSMSRAAGSLLLNDNVLEYAGEDHEILYTNLLKALNFLRLDSFDGAFVEIRRAHEKLELLNQKYAKAADMLSRGTVGEGEGSIEYKIDRVRFNNDAFARYLSMHMYAAEGLEDDARIDYDMLGRAFRTQSHIYNFDIPEVRYSSPDKAILSVVALTGLAPQKEEFNLRIRTDDQLKLVQVLYTDSEDNEVEYGHIPFPVQDSYYFKFAIPKIVPRSSPVHLIKAYDGSRLIGELQLLEDVARVAEETFKAKRSLIYFRSIARAIVKGYAAHKLKEKVEDTGGFVDWMKKAAIDVGTEVSEGADLRCARLLPGRIYVGDFEVDPGNYCIRIEYLDGNNRVLFTDQLDSREVRRNGFNLVETCYIR
jgi:hypothetical protein